MRKAVLGGDAFRFRGHPMASLQQAMTTALDVVGPMILRMDWHFGLAPADKSCITSDNPVFWTNPRAAGFWGTGLGSRHAELTYPLTAKIKLLGNWQGLRGVDDVNVEHVDHVNRLVALFANRFAFASSELGAGEALNARPRAADPDDSV